MYRSTRPLCGGVSPTGAAAAGDLANWFLRLLTSIQALTSHSSAFRLTFFFHQSVHSGRSFRPILPCIIRQSPLSRPAF